MTMVFSHGAVSARGCMTLRWAARSCFTSVKLFSEFNAVLGSFCHQVFWTQVFHWDALEVAFNLIRSPACKPAQERFRESASDPMLGSGATHRVPAKFLVIIVEDVLSGDASMSCRL